MSMLIHPPDRRQSSRGRSVSRVALAPSEGRAAGALLMVILRGSMLDRREDGSRLRGSQLRWLVAAFSCAAGTGPGGAPTPPWPEGPKSGTRRPAHRVPRVNRGPHQAEAASRLSLRNFACRCPNAS